MSIESGAVVSRGERARRDISRREIASRRASRAYLLRERGDRRHAQLGERDGGVRHGAASAEPDAIEGDDVFAGRRHSGVEQLLIYTAEADTDGTADESYVR